jgi:hypothetical protein
MIEAATRAWPVLNSKFPMKKTRRKGVYERHPERTEAMADAAAAILCFERLHHGKSILSIDA